MTQIIFTKGDTYYAELKLDYTLLEGDKLFLTVKKTADSEALIKKSYTSADFTDGVATIKFEPTDTDNLSVGDYRYDIELKYANGDKDTVVKSTLFKLTEEITSASDEEA